MGIDVDGGKDSEGRCNMAMIKLLINGDNEGDGGVMERGGGLVGMMYGDSSC